MRRAAGTIRSTKGMRGEWEHNKKKERKFLPPKNIPLWRNSDVPTRNKKNKKRKGSNRVTRRQEQIKKKNVKRSEKETRVKKGNSHALSRARERQRWLLGDVYLSIKYCF